MESNQITKNKKLMNRFSIFIRSVLLFLGTTLVSFFAIPGIVILMRMNDTYQYHCFDIESFMMLPYFLTSVVVILLVWQAIKSRWEGVAIGFFFLIYSVRSFMKFGEFVYVHKYGRALFRVHGNERVYWCQMLNPE